MAVILLFMSGCLSPFPQELSPGFYSDRLRKEQVPVALRSGDVTPMGRFSTVTGGCFQYQQASLERNIIIPALQNELQTRGANVADNVLATEPWYSQTLHLLVLPTLMGCSLWEVSGEALRVRNTSPVSAMSSTDEAMSSEDDAQPGLPDAPVEGDP